MSIRRNQIISEDPVNTKVARNSSILVSKVAIKKKNWVDQTSETYFSSF